MRTYALVVSDWPIWTFAIPQQQARSCTKLKQLFCHLCTLYTWHQAALLAETMTACNIKCSENSFPMIMWNVLRQCKFIDHLRKMHTCVCTNKIVAIANIVRPQTNYAPLRCKMLFCLSTWLEIMPILWRWTAKGAYKRQKRNNAGDSNNDHLPIVDFWSHVSIRGYSNRKK